MPFIYMSDEYKMIKFPPDSSRINNTIAYCLIECEKNSIKFAKKYYRKAIEINPADPDVRETKRCILLREGDVDDAIEEFQYCLALDPRRSIFYQHIGDAFFLKGDD